MVRWEPGTRDRLRLAALDLYLEQGYESTTVEQIAARAGVTERTYFRHFSDKREVLFDAQDALGTAFADGIASELDTTPMALVRAGLAASARIFPAGRRSWSRARQLVIDANPALHERETLKLDQLRAAITSALRDRGVVGPAASVAASVAISTFSLGFAQWIVDGEPRELAEIEDEMMTMWRALAAE